jgi:hypothetical protein
MMGPRESLAVIAGQKREARLCAKSPGNPSPSKILFRWMPGSRPGHDEGMKYERSANALAADWQAGSAGSGAAKRGGAARKTDIVTLAIMTLAILFAFASAVLLGTGMVESVAFATRLERIRLVCGHILRDACCASS